MKIVIDARMYGLEHAGIGRYVLNLVSQLEGVDDKNDYFILLRKKYFQQLKFKNFRFQKVLADYSHYSLKEQVFLPLQLIKLKPDLVHFPHFNVSVFWWGKQMVTIHDLIKHESKGQETTTRLPLLYWFKYLNYLFLVWVAIKRAKKIITSSFWWKEKIADKYHLSEDKISVIYDGVEKKFHQAPISQLSKTTKILKKYQIQKPFIIYTGSLYPHKNVENLIKALLIVNKTNKLYLTIVCARNVFYQRFCKKVKELGAENEVGLVGFIPDRELSLIYQQATAFVFPSKLEGFGLPGLEAMAVGLPVLASDIPVFREIYEKAVLYFSPTDHNNIALKIKEIMENKELQENLRKSGYNQVKKYSWEKMAKETLEVYESLR